MASPAIGCNTWRFLILYTIRPLNTFAARDFWRTRTHTDYISSPMPLKVKRHRLVHDRQHCHRCSNHRFAQRLQERRLQITWSNQISGDEASIDDLAFPPAVIGLSLSLSLFPPRSLFFSPSFCSREQGHRTRAVSIRI